MAWPTPQDFFEAIQNPAQNIDDQVLRCAVPVKDRLGLPVVSSGNFASVFRLKTRDGIDHAYRCFLSDRRDRAERYRKISDYVMYDDLECTVDFKYLENGIRVDGKWFPAVSMDWVEGVELDSYIDVNIGNPDQLRSLADRFLLMTEDLKAANVAHGDLQHGNIIITTAGLRLVDYDGMYAPSMTEREATELGHRNYQHPLRHAGHFGAQLDNFAAWLIYLSIQCLASDGTLWKGLRDALLWNETDLRHPEYSLIFSELEHHPDAGVVLASKHIRYLLSMPVDDIPPLTSVFHEPTGLEPILHPHVLKRQLCEGPDVGVSPYVVPASPWLAPTITIESATPLPFDFSFGWLAPGLTMRQMVATMGLPVEAGRDYLNKIEYVMSAQKERLVKAFGVKFTPFMGLKDIDGRDELVVIRGTIHERDVERLTRTMMEEFGSLVVRNLRCTLEFVPDTQELLLYQNGRFSRFRPPVKRRWFEIDERDQAYDARKCGRFAAPSVAWALSSDEFTLTTSVRDRHGFVPSYRPIGENGHYFSCDDFVQLRHFISISTKASPLAAKVFPDVAMKVDFIFVGGGLTYKRMCAVLMRFPSGLTEVVGAALETIFGHPDKQGCWFDGCATRLTDNNTFMQLQPGLLTVYYEPLYRKFRQTNSSWRHDELFRLSKVENKR